MNKNLLIIARLSDVNAKLESMKAVFWAVMRDTLPSKTAKKIYQMYWEFYPEVIEETLSLFQLSSHEIEQVKKYLSDEIDEAETKKIDTYFERPDLKL